MQFNSEVTPSEARQAWLEDAVRELRPLFASKGKPLPEKLRVSIGWSTSGKRALGSCYSDENSTDAHREIFVAPVVTESLRIMGTLAHECCHAALPFGHGHDKVFAGLGRSIGLVGKPKNLGEGGAAFAWFVANFVKAHGEYPSGAIASGSKAGKQGTAMLKVACKECGYTIRTTAKWLAFGTPLCPCNEQPMTECF